MIFSRKSCEWILGVVLLTALFAQKTYQQGTYLRAVNVVFRHGDRNPIKSYPGDPYQNESYWPEGFGSLTSRGKLRLYNLGKYMRKRYPNFQRKNVVIYSSDRNRTIASAMSNIAGFYGQNRSFLKHIDTYNPKGFGINVVAKDNDDFIMLTRPCPKWVKILTEFFERSETMRHFMYEHREALEVIRENTGLNFQTYSIDIVFLADTLIIEKERFNKLPQWAEELYASGELEEMRASIFTSMLHTFEMKRLRAGVLIQRFMDEMDAVIEQSQKSDSKYPSPKITIISGHDTTIVHWLVNLDIFDGKGPNYGAAVFIELHELTEYDKSKVDIKADGAEGNIEKRFVVKVFWKNESDSEPYAMTLPKCPIPCYFADFKKMLKPLMVDNFAETCRLDNDQGDYSSAGARNPIQDPVDTNNLGSATITTKNPGKSDTGSGGQNKEYMNSQSKPNDKPNSACFKAFNYTILFLTVTFSIFYGRECYNYYY